MRLGGRLRAAIEVFDDIARRHRPPAQALKDWGLSHRFAGAADRAAIGNLVHDGLRQKRSLSWRMGDESARTIILGVAVFDWGLPPDALAAQFAGDPHAPEPLSEAERAAMAAASLEDAPDAVRADVPDWLWPEFAAAYGDNAVAEGEALGQRAPLDLRVNTLKCERDKALKALSRFGVEATAISPLGLRIEAAPGPGRLPNVQAEPAFQKGWFEVQDEASQLAALLAGAEPGMQIADICAGAGGKTLALSAIMENKGQIHAYDADRHRLKGIFERLKRAGTRNVQVLPPGEEAALAPLERRMDVVFADAPCSGSGVWRRRPDAKWRLSEAQLAARVKEQEAVLDLAARLVRPGGRIVYATCSLLARENGAQVTAFLERHKDFAPAPLGFMLAAIADVRRRRGRDDWAGAIGEGDSSVQLTPLRDSTDGFFVAGVRRNHVT